MSSLSIDAGLGVRYTNHCIRATCITILDKNGFEACDIMHVSSHKSEQSIKSYSKTSDERKRQMSIALAGNTTPQKFKKPSATVTKSQLERENAKENIEPTEQSNPKIKQEQTNQTEHEHEHERKH